MTTPSPITAQPAPVLMALMEHFRGRHLLQIQGEPNQALAALVGALPQHPAEPAEVKGWRSWLDSNARRAAWFQGAYGLTEWGKDLARRQAEQEHQRLSAHERHARAERSEVGVWKNETDRLSLEAMDQSVLVGMHQQGWLSHVPQHQERPNGLAIPGPVSFNSPGAPGVTYMVSNAQGDFHWDGEPGQGEHRLKVGPHGSQRTIARWQVLLHEAAHCEFPLLSAPFCPTEGQWSEQSVKIFNQWVSSNITTRRADFRSVLNECFADVYGAMMLLHYTEHSPDTQAVLAQVLALRTEDRERSDDEMASLADAWLPGVVADTHATDFALRRALDDREAWQGQSPQVLLQLACQYASDGLLDFIHPQRLTRTGYPIGGMLCEELGGAERQHASLTGYEAFLADLWVSKIRGGHPEPHLHEAGRNHPAGAMLEQAWQWMKPRLEEAFAHSPEGFDQAVSRFEISATSVVHKTVYGCFKKFCSSHSRALRDVAIEEKRAFASLQEELRHWQHGLAPGMAEPSTSGSRPSARFR